MSDNINFDEFRKFIIQNKIMTSNELTDFQKIRNSTKDYKYPSSNQQFNQILKKKYNHNTYARFLSLIARFFQRDKYYNVIHYLFNKSKVVDDISTFKKLNFYIKNNLEKSDSYLNMIAEKYVNKIQEFIPLESVKNYLDFGCGQCIFTQYLGEALELKQSNIYGTDLEDQFEKGWDKDRESKKITFEYIKDGRIPFSVKFDVITCMMVLHHIPPNMLIDQLKNIHSSMNPGSIFILKEHDFWDSIDRMIFDLEHSLFLVSKMESEEEIEKNKDMILGQKIYYLSKYEWDFILAGIGFDLLYREYSFPSIKAEIKTNRNYVAFYKRGAI